MRSMTNLFIINGKPMLTPDADVAVSYEDIDAADAGRDQAGYMHRSLVRSKVGSWSFTYHFLTEEEKNYMESIFPASGTFNFTHPARNKSGLISTMCYRSKYTISWRNAKTGLWSGYGFTIIEC